MAPWSGARRGREAAFRVYDDSTFSTRSLCDHDNCRNYSGGNDAGAVFEFFELYTPSPAENTQIDDEEQYWSNGRLEV